MVMLSMKEQKGVMVLVHFEAGLIREAEAA
jgi:hypothetical protein